MCEDDGRYWVRTDDPMEFYSTDSLEDAVEHGNFVLACVSDFVEIVDSAYGAIYQFDVTCPLITADMFG